MPNEKKLVMPKGDGRVELAVSALKIYYEANKWVTNDEFKEAFKSLDSNSYDDNTNESMILHKARTARYFGFIRYLFKAENGLPGKQGRITQSGKRFYEAYLANNKEAMIDTVMDSIANYTFGRDNYSTDESDSDVEPPKALIKFVCLLGYLTKEEFIYAMYSLHDDNKEYKFVLDAIRKSREDEIDIKLPSELSEKERKHFINVYGDWKFTQFIREVGILQNVTDKAILVQAIKDKYSNMINNWSVYNNVVQCEENQTSVEVGFPKDLPYNRIVFGAPGTGKSNQLEKDRKIFESNYERVTFHPNYSYAQFVGSYKPVPYKDSDGKDAITYEYVAGPFMRILVKAMTSMKKAVIEPYLLIIEEINRANVAAVFGDVFQLLDRKDGISEYEIETSADMRKYMQKELGGELSDYEKIRIPNNMYIWATMNSADQGVFPIDTAFKRRWDFEYIGINKNADKIMNVKVLVGEDKHCINWDELRRSINNILSNQCKINEDKLLGPFFLSNEVIEIDEDTNMVNDNEKFLNAFKSKVLMYLYEDAGKQYKTRIFSGCDDFSTYSSVCNEFDVKGEKIFGDDIEVSIQPLPVGE